MKTLQLDSAAVVSRQISRILRENGFQRACKHSHSYWTEGFHVSRVGYSSTVHVDWYHPDFKYSHMHRQVSEERKSKIAQMREVLFELGYKFSHPHAIYIECLDS